VAVPAPESEVVVAPQRLDLIGVVRVVVGVPKHHPLLPHHHHQLHCFRRHQQATLESGPVAVVVAGWLESPHQVRVAEGLD
jgi:hypothetical protein